uniref:Uncharacterized protein n=1 Tax=Cacopsylla melanoneura TaxID=428564 RepID=A0A8D9AYX1_9HEMI
MVNLGGGGIPASVVFSVFRYFSSRTSTSNLKPVFSGFELVSSVKHSPSSLSSDSNKSGDFKIWESDCEIVELSRVPRDFTGVPRAMVSSIVLVQRQTVGQGFSTPQQHIGTAISHPKCQ